MRARATILEHPIHQILVPIPLGLFIGAVIFDVIAYTANVPELSIASYWMIIAGVIGGLVAAVFGAIDWTAIPAGTRAKRVGAIHAVLNVTLVAGFAFAAWMRSDAVARAPDTFALAIELGAFGLACLAGFLGGELVNRHAIGIIEGAGPDRRRRPAVARVQPSRTAPTAGAPSTPG